MCISDHFSSGTGAVILRMMLSLQSHHIEYVLNVLAQVVVADRCSCCCRASQPCVLNCDAWPVPPRAGPSLLDSVPLPIELGASPIADTKMDGEVVRVGPELAKAHVWAPTWREPIHHGAESHSCPSQSSSALCDVIQPWIFAFPGRRYWHGAQETGSVSVSY
jgi:hypothetical protein